MKRLVLPILTTAALLFAAAPVSAQCAPAMGTGCPDAMAGMCRTDPVIGTQFEFMCPSCMRGMENSFIFLGLPVSPLMISPPITCGDCILGVQPLVVMQRHMLRLQIPNEPKLIAAQFSIQCVCRNMMMGCLELAARMDVTIMP